MCQVCAAALMSISRAAAPALKNISNRERIHHYRLRARKDSR